MFNDKKMHKQICFSVANKNLNWEIITKNLVTFKLLKDEMKLRMKNVNIMGFTEKFDFRKLCKKLKYRGTNWLKGMGSGEGSFENFLIYEGLGKKERQLVFLRVG